MPVLPSWLAAKVFNFNEVQFFNYFFHVLGVVSKKSLSYSSSFDFLSCYLLGVL